MAASLESESCPSPDSLRALIDGGLGSREEERITQHLDVCEKCQGSLDTLAGGGQQTLDSVGNFLGAQKARSPEIDQLYKAEAKNVGWQTVLAPPPDGATEETIGQLGRYQIREHIATGGMGIVFRGYDPATERTVAIKVLAPAWAANETSRERFLREARSVATLDHAHILPIYTVEEHERYPYLVMPFNDGETLEQRVRREGPMEFETIRVIGIAIAKGLASAHEHGIIHRDLKPANVLIRSPDDHVRLADFGLARAADTPQLTVPGSMPGTPQFMAPEQINGQDVDHRADLFAFGCLLHFMATGEAPFDGVSISKILQRVTEEAPSKIDRRQPGWYRSLLRDLLAKDPDKRPADASIIEERLHTQRSPLARRHLLMAGAGLLGAGGLGVWLGRKSTPQEVPSQVINERSGDVFATLHEAVARSQPGDHLELRGHFPCNSGIIVPPNHPLHFRSMPGESAAISTHLKGQCLLARSDVSFEGLRFVRSVLLEPSDELAPGLVAARDIDKIQFKRCRFEVPWQSGMSKPASSSFVDLGRVKHCLMDQCEGYGLSTIGFRTYWPGDFTEPTPATIRIELKNTVLVCMTAVYHKQIRRIPEFLLDVVLDQATILGDAGLLLHAHVKPVAIMKLSKLSLSLNRSLVALRHDLVSVLKASDQRLVWKSMNSHVLSGGMFLDEKLPTSQQFRSFEEARDAGYAFTDHGSEILQGPSDSHSKLTKSTAAALDLAQVRKALPNGWNLPSVL